MIRVRKSEERGHFDHGWLDTFHSFSFGDYYDTKNMGFRDLRVINEDVVQPSEGFPRHGHKDMEIITYVLEGALEHKDSLGTGSVIKPDDVQHMSAGTGVLHSEYNHSKEKPVHLLQIWILPKVASIKPHYQQKAFSAEKKRNRLCLVASGDGRNESVQINQDALMFASLLSTGSELEYKLTPNNGAWVQVTKGQLNLNGNKLQPGDGAAIEGEDILKMKAEQDSEFLLFDLK